MFRRITALVTKEFIQLSRDLFFVIAMLLGPASELTAIAYATSTSIQHLPMAVYDRDGSPQSRELITRLSNTGTFDVQVYARSQEELIGLFDQGQVYAAVTIPPQFSAELEGANPAVIQVILNGAESTAAQTAQETLEGVLAAYNIDLVRQYTPQSSNLSALQPSARVWYNEELREANYTIPSEVGFMLYMVALWVAALSISRERELGTLEQLMVTPLTRFEMVIGKSVPAVVISYANFLLMMAMTIFLFKVPLRGSVPLLMGLALFYILMELQRGLLVSSLVKSQQQGLLVIFLMAFLDMTFAGYAVPVESMPRFFQALSYIFPIRHWLIIMRGIMLKGVGLEVFWPNVLAIAGLGIFLTACTLLAFQRTLSAE